MRKNYYLLEAEINPQAYLHYNAFSNQFLLLNKEKHDIFQDHDCKGIETRFPSFYQTLADNYFIVPDEFDESEIVKQLKRQMQYDASMYQVMVNTTLDCNLHCWYCYEHLLQGSRLKEEVIVAIEKNVEIEYNTSRFNILKMSFFGGEPFLNFEGIEKLLDYAKEFCEKRNVQLIADFTTNATLINIRHIEYLKEFRCHFQITLDGDKEVHNSVKKDKYRPGADTYQKTIDALRLIDSEIPNRWIAVRVNFDNRTLHKIDEIIADIDFLDRKNSYVILKKVWQIQKEKVDKPLLYDSIQKFFDKKFLLDYYMMPKGCLCFAERNRHVLFNYDGKVFKCSTISSFDDENALGKLDIVTGQLQWDPAKIAYWLKDITPEKCIKCKWFPACFGPCNKQLLANKGQKMCTFDAINMNTKDFLIYTFKFHLLKDELNKTA